jgi:hypothetical protein
MTKASAYMETNPLKLHPYQATAHARVLLTKLGRMTLALHRVYWCYENPEAVEEVAVCDLKVGVLCAVHVHKIIGSVFFLDK